MCHRGFVPGLGVWEAGSQNEKLTYIYLCNGEDRTCTPATTQELCPHWSPCYYFWNVQVHSCLSTVTLAVPYPRTLISLTCFRSLHLDHLLRETFPDYLFKMELPKASAPHPLSCLFVFLSDKSVFYSHVFSAILYSSDCFTVNTDGQVSLLLYPQCLGQCLVGPQ